VGVLLPWVRAGCKSEGSSSFLKKRTKKLLSVPAPVRHYPKQSKVFWFFFSKKNCLLLFNAPPPAWHRRQPAA
jgi:hypothetical protein